MKKVKRKRAANKDLMHSIEQKTLQELTLTGILLYECLKDLLGRDLSEQIGVHPKGGFINLAAISGRDKMSRVDTKCLDLGLQFL